MSTKFDPAQIAKAVSTPRWSALVRTGVDASAIATWDPGLVRETRVLVPIDVQAMYVPAGSVEPMVRIPLSLTAPDGQPPAPQPPVLAPGTPRPSGVHLHWAPPDALLRGSLGDHGDTNRLQLPPLPDRWLVVRLVVPKGATQAVAAGTIVEADTAKAIPLATYPAGAAAAPQAGRTVAAEDLTASVGGSLNWVGVYDAVLNRLAFFDPLADLAAIAPNGVEGDQISYLVAGWWSTPALDPLDRATTSTSLQSRLHELGWALTDDVEGGDQLNSSHIVARMKQESLGLATATRYASPEPGVTGPAPVSNIDAAILPVNRSFSASAFVDEVIGAVQTEPAVPRSTLLHGCIFGVPIAGAPPVDNRPVSASVGVVLGEQGDDVAAALASSGLDPGDLDARRATERLLAAFTGHLLDRIGSSDGLVDVEEYEHAAAFTARDGGPGGTDRLQSGRQLGGFAAGRQARSAAVRLGNAAPPVKGVRVTAFAKSKSQLKIATLDDQRSTVASWAGPRPDVEPSTEAREVVRPAPRLYVPSEPIVAMRGAGRCLRYGGSGRFSQDGLLHCRWPSQVAHTIAHVVEGADLVPSLGTGAAPREVQALAEECVTINPYLAPWIASVASKAHGLDAAATTKRMVAEAVLRFGTNAVYDGQTAAFQATPAGAAAAAQGTAARFTAGVTSSLVADQLRRFSLVAGTDPYPVGVTAWSQPWVPLWLEWEAALDVADRLDGWALGPVDQERDLDVDPPTVTKTFRGRSVLTTGSATTLASAIRDWMTAEDQRDQHNQGEADPATEAALGDVATHIENLDVLAASLDGIREQLLGFVYDGGLVRPKKDDGTLDAPETTGEAPMFLRAGALTLTAARIVDVFGRTLDLPIDTTRIPARNDVPGQPRALLLRPRVTAPSRVLFRFVDPDPAATTPAEARVDQVDPAKVVNPVAGFLLPDHIDESLEVFDVNGAPLGELSHEPFGGGVTWEIAPGRTGPPDAGPLFDLTGGTQHAGLFAAGVVAADAKARAGQPADPTKESALSALLRAIDTTLWTVDTFKALGSEHIAGLVGRPIAVVRATLMLGVEPDLGLDAAAAAAALSDRAFTVRIGELTRADDGLLAYFVNDDYEHVHLVDKIIAELALDSGRQRGQLATYGTAPEVPPQKPIEHPYVIAVDELSIRPNQLVSLTLLMLPAGNVHLTCGVLPRKSLQLARDWVAPGLSVMAPSARIGPVLVDPALVRLPKISAFPKDQIFTRRDTPSSWKDDPILAATQTALLPDLPHEVQEGYIRIAPDQGDGTS
jgi:hypothetical protein